MCSKVKNHTVGKEAAFSTVYLEFSSCEFWKNEELQLFGYMRKSPIPTWRKSTKSYGEYLLFNLYLPHNVNILLANCTIFKIPMEFFKFLKFPYIPKIYGKGETRCFSEALNRVIWPKLFPIFFPQSSSLPWVNKKVIVQEQTSKLSAVLFYNLWKIALALKDKKTRTVEVNGALTRTA